MRGIATVLLFAASSCEVVCPEGGVPPVDGFDGCGVNDYGWNFWCEDGTVYVDDLTEYQLCRAGETEPACILGGEGDARVAAECDGGCFDDRVHWIETFDEFAEFEPTDLCASCHIDCSAYIQCVGGQLGVYAGGPISCVEWRGCAHVWIECAEGCFLEGARYDEPFVEDPTFLCAEAPAAAAGQPCANDSDCLPTRAQLQADGSVTQDYLACDLASGTCVAADAPLIAGWLEPCEGLEVLTGQGVAGYAVDPSGNYCLVQDDAACLHTARTRACAGDWDCPAGAVCSDDLAPQLGAAQTPLCEPGWHGLADGDLPACE